MKRNDWQENHQLGLKLNHSHCNHLIVAKTRQDVVSSILSSLEENFQKIHALTPILG